MVSRFIFYTILTFIMLSFHSAWSCPTNTTAKNTTWKGKSVCIIQGGTYTEDILLKKEFSYHLQGAVFIGNDNKDNATLTIQPGVFIGGGTGDDFLVITRGSQIKAEGHPDNPIVFTTYVDNPQRGSWGGLVINGNAPINCVNPNSQGFCEDAGEGSTGTYGGHDPMDDSGVLKYVRVEWAGDLIDDENQLNGIAFQGVGAKTLVDFIQVHQGADDGIEFFGGTVNVKHVYLTGNQDDSMDWTNGWTGRAQFVFIKQADDEGNHGIEASNRTSPMNVANPRSNPTISHVTLVGSTSAKTGGAGILLKEGTSIKLYNSVIKGFKEGGIDVDHKETFRSGHIYVNDFPGIHIANTVFDNETNFIVDKGEPDIRKWILEDMDMDILFGLEPVREENLGYESIFVPYIYIGKMEAVLPEDETGFFEDVSYIGAFDPEKEHHWAWGWTVD